MEHQIIQTLIQRGKSVKAQGIHQSAISGEDKFEEALKDIHKYPHIFVLGCIGDKQMDADRAWKIPVTIAKHIQSLEWTAFHQLSENDFISLFDKHNLHRYNTITAKSYFQGIQRIQSHYGGDASKIWSDTPSSSLLVRRFLQFHGIGVKIATMAANILVRDYKIPVKDRTCIDISPDTHVMRVFIRTGLVSSDEPKEAMIYKAREISPDYPGIIDYPMFEIGRSFCHARTRPNCKECYLNAYCPKNV
jgi:endonuclease-3